MREPSTRRDQREIVVPRDMRPAKATAKAAPRRAAPARTGAPGEVRAMLGALCRSVGGACLARPGEAIGSVAALAAVAYVAVNALGLQAGRHPAPILPQPGPALARAEPASVPKPTSVPKPASRAEEAAPKDKTDSREKPDPRLADKAPARDGIGDILRSAGDTTASVTPKPVEAVAQAQRALSRLGYGTLKADGVMGPGTKAGLEKFERDHKLPVTGEAAGRTLRELTKAYASKHGPAKPHASTPVPSKPDASKSDASKGGAAKG